MRRFLFLLIIVLCDAPGPAQACALSIETTSTTSFAGAAGRGYDVFDPTTYFQPLTFRVRAVEGTCPFYITAGPANSATGVGQLLGTGGTLSFAVYREANDAQVLRAGALATAAEVLTGRLKEKETASYQLTYAIPPQQIVAAGAFTGDVEIAVYEGNVGSGVLRARQIVPLSTMVAAVTELSFAQGQFDPNVGVYLLNFNTMHRGDIKGVTLHTRSNGGYRIYLRSVNGGVMRQLVPLDNSAVPYTLSVDGKTIPITDSDIQVVSFPGATSPSGNAHRVDVLIGDIAGVAAGDYADLISISIYSFR